MQTAQQAIQDSIKHITSIGDAICLLKTLPEFNQANYGVYSHSSCSEVTINLPFNWQVYKQFRPLLGKGWKAQGWLNTQHRDNTIHKHQRFTHPNFRSEIRISLCTELTGTTCHLEQVGEETKPIFKVVCS